MLTALLPAGSVALLGFFFVLGSAALYAYVPFRLTLNHAQGTHICANKDGLGVPAGIMGYSRWLPWSQLRRADMEHDCLKLEFKPGGEVKLNTKHLQESNVEQLLLALEIWGQKGIWSPALIDYRDNLQNKKLGIDEHNYTKLWEEELNRRFNSTTFVPLEPGAKLRSGALTILRQLAFGGFSAVYLAENDNREQIVIKESVTGDGDSGHEKALEFFKREALFLCNLKHDQIAHVLDNFVENGRSYLVLEYVPGENLREYVKRNGRQEEQKVLGWMWQLANILQYLHEQDPPIVHRDFTPDNIVLRPDGSLVVIDFGAANQFVSAATGTLVGKQSYMPPEQVRGKAKPATDLYALGCTAHFLLTGHDPEALTVCHPKLERTGISEETDQIIAALTQQESKDRIADANTIVERLQKISTKYGAKFNNVKG